MDAEHFDCPDCGCSVVPHDGSVLDSVGDFRMFLHRVTCCVASAAMCHWYHDVALRLVLTADMARAILGARAALALWHSSDMPAWERSCLPFLEHLLFPSALCPPGKAGALQCLLHATRLFLTAVGAAGFALPDAASFCPLPTLPFLPARAAGEATTIYAAFVLLGRGFAVPAACAPGSAWARGRSPVGTLPSSRSAASGAWRDPRLILFIYLSSETNTNVPDTSGMFSST